MIPTDTDAPAGSSPKRPKGRIDPRIRARRVAVTREKGRRRLRVLVGITALAALAGAAWLALESPALDVDRIIVHGTRDVPVEAVVGAAGVEAGDALAFVDTGAARAAVEALPRIATAKVRRSFPGTLAITVIERDAIAWTLRPTPAEEAEDVDAAPAPSVVLLDTGGRVIEDTVMPPPGLVQIQGLGELPAVGEPVRPMGAVTLLGDLPELLRVQVTAVTVDHGEVTLALAPRVDGRPSAQEIRLGVLRDVPAKGVAAAAVLEALDVGVGYLDVRVPTAPATGG
ncbi:MAG TPA: FtsQ-type POTRA domain-containing protein [Acidimicrobiia bacterium]|nr:FtsQ-type POTRA domain-containing protein [Acidimicrobiia bacterium]